MKKFGSFLFTFVPVLGSFAMMLLGTTFAIGITAIIFFAGGSDYIDFMKILLDPDYNICIMLFYGLGSIFIYGVWYQYRYEGDLKPKAKIVLNPLLILSLLFLVPLAQLISMLLATLAGAVVPGWMEQYEKIMESAGLIGFPSPITLFYSVIIAPICEEIIFRGLTLRQAKKAMPFWFANFLQAALFGLFHMNWIQGIYAFALGIFLGFVCEYSGSIYYSILLHFGFNFYGTIISCILAFIKDETMYDIVSLGLVAVSFVVGVPLFIVGMLNQRKIVKADALSTS